MDFLLTSERKQSSKYFNEYLNKHLMIEILTVQYTESRYEVPPDVSELLLNYTFTVADGAHAIDTATTAFPTL